MTKNNPRNLSVQILNRIEEKRAFAQPLLDAYLSRDILANTQDRGLLTRIVYGTLRLRNRLDWVIRVLYTGNFESMESGIRNILRVALYQMMFADRVPAYAATDEAVEITKKMYPGRSNLVNAILRNAVRRMNTIKYPLFDEDPLLHISVLHSHPLWIVKMWAEQLGIEDTLALCKSNNEIPPLAIRANRLKTTRPDLTGMLEDCGCGAAPSRYSPDGIVLSDLPAPVGKMRLHEEGYMQIQDEASQLISLLLDPQPGEMALDVCAGAGIKTTHMAELMQNRGRIVAMDISRKKVEMSHALSLRLGATIIEPVVHDATKAPLDDLRGKFDRVLVDVPCSGMGTLRRNPEIKWNTTPEDLKKIPHLQKEILNRSVPYLKKEGIMVYSTCTISAEENEAVVRNFLAVHPDFECIRQTTSPADMLDRHGMFRTFPHRHGTDGFFGAVLRIKKEGGLG
ncbi:MAG: 16S rRNA (cytosine(967)-C(5))-methyltransferase RsmB [Deltaproteobacteria bacterium]|nr:16S rRNA (cytosine(967)-C(5))-methyltransferase RsmB [Deltaproteobacteria bacterium]MBW2595911.1 16S rRNA (cytosine(967)-C(5))-methyltransferase RsmB [Deltaproteobacteria bacterium]